VLVEEPDHVSAVYEGFGHALRVYFFHAELAHQQYIQHGYWQLAGAKFTAELRKQGGGEEGFAVKQ